MFIYRGRGVGERSCPLMAINWPLNGWLKKIGRIYGRSGKRRVLQQTAAEMNSAPCKILQGTKFRNLRNFAGSKIAASSPLQHLQKKKKKKRKPIRCEELNLKLREFSKERNFF